MSKKRLALESIVFSTLICFACILFMVIQGQMLTINYVPDISSYSNTETLQSQVSFGVINRLNGWIYAGGFVLLSVLYGTIRWIFGANSKSPK